MPIEQKTKQRKLANYQYNAGKLNPVPEPVRWDFQLNFTFSFAQNLSNLHYNTTENGVRYAQN